MAEIDSTCQNKTAYDGMDHNSLNKNTPVEKVQVDEAYEKLHNKFITYGSRTPFIFKVQKK